MKECIYRSILDTAIGFSAVLLYCFMTIAYKFSIVDLLYLFVVVVCFVLYLKSVKKL